METRRKNLRLKNYDYAQEGAYYITICTWGRECLFGNIVNGEMELNGIGWIVRQEWLRSPMIRPNVQLDEFMIMPNHMHGIIIINERRGELQFAPTPFRSPSQTIGAIVRGFKSSTTKQINVFRNMPNLTVWQRNYYEHIIRDQFDLDRIRGYIADNPKNWALDEENIIGA